MGAQQLFTTLAERICWCNCLGLGFPLTAEEAMKGWMSMKNQELDWGPRAKRGTPRTDRILRNVTDNMAQYVHVLLVLMLVRTFFLRSFFTCLPWLFGLLMASVYVPLSLLPQVEVKFRVAGTMGCLALV